MLRPLYSKAMYFLGLCPQTPHLSATESLSSLAARLGGGGEDAREEEKPDALPGFTTALKLTKAAFNVHAAAQSDYVFASFSCN